MSQEAVLGYETVWTGAALQGLSQAWLIFPWQMLMSCFNNTGRHSFLQMFISHSLSSVSITANHLLQHLTLHVLLYPVRKDIGSRHMLKQVCWTVRDQRRLWTVIFTVLFHLSLSMNIIIKKCLKRTKKLNED